MRGGADESDETDDSIWNEYDEETALADPIEIGAQGNKEEEKEEGERKTGSMSQDEEESDSASDDEETENDYGTKEEDNKPLHPALSSEPIPINITTMLGLSVIDHSIEITAHRSRSIGFLKASLQKQLPGRPPVSILQLRLGPRALPDDLLINELIDDDDEEDDDDEMTEGPGNRLTLVLDMIPPIDSKSALIPSDKLDDLTPSQLLDAYAANEASMYQNALLMMKEEQQEAQQDGMVNETDLLDISDSSHDSITMLLKNRANRLRQDLELKLLQSAASQTVLAETIPPSHKIMNLQEREIRGQRVRQVAQGGVKTTLKRNIQRSFNVNWADTIRNVCLFLFFGYFGGRSPTSRAILLLGAPSVILLQARPVKIWLRHMIYLLLMHPPSIVLSLLPAPQQTILSIDVDKAMENMYGDFYQDKDKGKQQLAIGSEDSDFHFADASGIDDIDPYGSDSEDDY